MPFIGNQPAENYASFLTQTFSVTATASYTLDHAVSNENDIRLVINNVVQQPGSGKAYTASGTTLTLSEATASTDVMYCVYLGRALQTVNPPNASVGTSQLVDGAVTSSKLNSGKVLQVVGTQTSTVFSTTSTSYVDVTGFSLSITPSSTSNKILVLLNFRYGNSASVANTCQLLRNTDVIDLGGVNNNLGNVYIGHGSSGKGFGQVSFNYFDTPSSTSALTYKLQVHTDTGGTLYINNRNDGNATTNIMGSLTLMEISA